MNIFSVCHNSHLDAVVSVVPTFGVRVVLQNKLGGGEGIEGLYGTLAYSGMQKVLDCMAAHCGMTRESRLVDMGAGIGRSAQLSLMLRLCPALSHCMTLLTIQTGPEGLCISFNPAPLIAEDQSSMHCACAYLQQVPRTERVLHSRRLNHLLWLCRPLLHAMVGGYATRAWGIEIDRVKCDKGNAFMRYAAADMAKRRAEWGAFDVPTIRCAPIEQACCSSLPQRGCSNISYFLRLSPILLNQACIRLAGQADQSHACTGLRVPCRGLCVPHYDAICRQRVWALGSVCLILATSAGEEPGQLDACLLVLGGRPSGFPQGLRPAVPRVKDAAGCALPLTAAHLGLRTHRHPPSRLD